MTRPTTSALPAAGQGTGDGRRWEGSATLGDRAVDRLGDVAVEFAGQDRKEGGQDRQGAGEV